MESYEDNVFEIDFDEEDEDEKKKKSGRIDLEDDEKDVSGSKMSGRSNVAAEESTESELDKNFDFGSGNKKAGVLDKPYDPGTMKYPEMVPADPHDYITDFEGILKKSNKSNIGKSMEPVINSIEQLKTLLARNVNRNNAEDCIDSARKAYEDVAKKCSTYAKGRHPWLPSGKKRLQAVKCLKKQCITEASKVRAAIHTYQEYIPEGAAIGDIFEYKFREWDVAMVRAQEKKNSDGWEKDPDHSISNEIEGDDLLFMQQVAGNGVMSGTGTNGQRIKGIASKYNHIEAESAGTKSDFGRERKNYSGEAEKNTVGRSDYSYEELRNIHVNDPLSKSRWSFGKPETPFAFYSIYNFLSTGKFKQFDAKSFTYLASYDYGDSFKIYGAYLTETPILNPKGLSSKEAKKTAAFLKKSGMKGVKEEARKVLQNFTMKKEEMVAASRERGIIDEAFMERRLDLLLEVFDSEDNEFRDDAV